MADHKVTLEAPSLVSVAFDSISGNVKSAPSWIKRSGFEWLFRLYIEPDRPWKRYNHYPKFFLLVDLDIFGINIQSK